MSERVISEGVVSVFLGQFPSESAFDDYLAEVYSPDQSSVACAFWSDLGLDWWDHDSQDALYQGNEPVPVRSFLENEFSYVESIRPAVIAACERGVPDMVNAGIFMYDYEYPSGRPFRSPYLRFIGSFPYVKY